MPSIERPQKHDNRVGLDDGAIIALDVGGTTIQSAVVSRPARVETSTMMPSDAMSSAPTKVLLAHLAGIIDEQRRRANRLDKKTVGVGLAFPGPFDYENGICLIQGLHKFDSIYGINLKEFLADLLDVPIDAFHFMNDADAFAVGESLYGVGHRYLRAIYLTVGTGIGSSFIASGNLVNQDAPYGGRIFQAPYRDGVADDTLSRRGILSMAKELGYPHPHHDVADIAEQARGGHPVAIAVFERLGDAMATILAPICKAFEPDAIVLGGQIAKSNSLFVPSMSKGLQDWHGDIETTQDALESTWLGLTHHFSQSAGESQRVVNE